MGQPPHDTPRVRFLFKPLAVLLSLAFALAVTEIGLRLFFPRAFRLPPEEGSLSYRYDARLGWMPRANNTVRFTGTRTVTLTHNRQGFRGPEPVISNKPGVIFLGDSLVWGYDVEAPERFTDKLQARHPEWAVYNLGVSGFGTDQEYLLLQQCFDQYQPRMVFLVFCNDNDREDNCWNIRYADYYKPYFTVEGNQLRLHGMPVPRSERVFLAEHSWLAEFHCVGLLARAYFKLAAPAPARHEDPTLAILAAMNQYVRQRGAHFAVGLQYSQTRLVSFLETNQIPHLDLATTNHYPAHGRHWTPAGHDFVCRAIEEFIEQRKLLP